MRNFVNKLGRKANYYNITYYTHKRLDPAYLHNFKSYYSIPDLLDLKY